MKLSAAAQYFNRVSFDGWNAGTQTWDTGVAVGTFEVYDRFISSRTFGQKKRILLLGGTNEIAATYEVVRDSDGGMYLVESRNPDLGEFGRYSNVYQLHSAPHSLEVIAYVEGPPRSSGAPGDVVPTVVDTLFGDFERFSGTDSRELEHPRYSLFTIWLPGSADVGKDNDLRVGSLLFDVQEAVPMLNVLELRAVQGTT